MSEPYHGVSNDPNVPGVDGEGGVGVYGKSTTPAGNGVIGYSDDGRGVYGHIKTGKGVWGFSEKSAGVYGQSASDAGILGEGGTGVYGRATIPNGSGVIGYSDSNRGVYGHSKIGTGVWGFSEQNRGVYGESNGGEGVRGLSHSAHGAVVGINDSPAEGNGGSFESNQGEGVRGTAKNAHHAGVVGVNTSGGSGVYGESDGAGGIGVYGKGAALAGFFVGNVGVTGYISFEKGADFAEDFDIADVSAAEPGSVMVLDDAGALRESDRPYDKRVAGVVSGAESYQPGLILDRKPSQGNRKPIALVGKVFCKVDAQYGPIEVGDLLTTSPTAGHAMRAGDPLKAFGAVIGKALRPLASGQGLIPVLIALQ